MQRCNPSARRDLEARLVRSRRFRNKPARGVLQRSPFLRLETNAINPMEKGNQCGGGVCIRRKLSVALAQGFAPCPRAPFTFAPSCPRRRRIFFHAPNTCSGHTPPAAHFFPYLELRLRAFSFSLILLETIQTQAPGAN